MNPQTIPNNYPKTGLDFCNFCLLISFISSVWKTLIIYCLKHSQNKFFLCSSWLIWIKLRNFRWTSLLLWLTRYILSKQQFSSSYNFLERLFSRLKFIMFISVCSHFRKHWAECHVDAFYHIWISHCTLKQITPCIYINLQSSKLIGCFFSLLDLSLF